MLNIGPGKLLNLLVQVDDGPGIIGSQSNDRFIRESLGCEMFLVESAQVCSLHRDIRPELLHAQQYVLFCTEAKHVLLFQECCNFCQVPAWFVGGDHIVLIVAQDEVVPLITEGVHGHNVTFQAIGFYISFDEKIDFSLRGNIVQNCGNISVLQCVWYDHGSTIRRYSMQFNCMVSLVFV
jgi:hypothetical protein